MDNNLIEEIRYVRGRVDEIYNVLNTENGRITKLETRLDAHTYNNYKNMTITIAIVTILVSIIDVVLAYI